MKIYLQYGAGNIAIPGWLNFDSSLTLRIQKTPIIGKLLKPKLNCIFDDGVQYGDIVRGLPLPEGSVDGVFCSHVLEHLSLNDFHVALDNTYKLLKERGRFRCVVPNLKYYIEEYTIAQSTRTEYSSYNETPAHKFNIESHFGLMNSRRGILQRMYEAFSNNTHRWMWDEVSLSLALHEHGFIQMKPFSIGSCDDENFLLPERSYQFDKNALAFECFKK